MSLKTLHPKIHAHTRGAGYRCQVMPETRIQAIDWWVGHLYPSQQVAKPWAAPAGRHRKHDIAPYMVRCRRQENHKDCPPLWSMRCDYKPAASKALSIGGA